MGDSYAAVIGGKPAREGAELLRARWANGKHTSERIAGWIGDWSKLQSRHAAELEKFLANHVIGEEELGTLAEPWQRIASMVLEQSRLSNDAAKRAIHESEQPIRNLSRSSKASELIEKVAKGHTESINGVESLDLDRLDEIKTSLTRFATIEVDRAQGQVKAAERATKAWISFDSRDDIQSYVAQVVSGVDTQGYTRNGNEAAFGAIGAAATGAAGANDNAAASRQSSQATVRRKSSFMGSIRDNNSSNGLRSKFGTIFGLKKNKGAKGQKASQHPSGPNSVNEATDNLSLNSNNARTRPPDFGLTERQGPNSQTDSSTQTRKSNQSGLNNQGGFNNQGGNNSQPGANSQPEQVSPSSLRHPRARQAHDKTNTDGYLAKDDDSLYAQSSPIRADSAPLTPTKHQPSNVPRAASPLRSSSPLRQPAQEIPYQGGVVDTIPGAIPNAGNASASASRPPLPVTGTHPNSGSRGPSGTVAPGIISAPGVSSAPDAVNDIVYDNSSYQAANPNVGQFQQDLSRSTNANARSSISGPPDEFDSGAISAAGASGVGSGVGSGIGSSAPAPPPARHSLHRVPSLTRSPSTASTSRNQRDARVGSQVFTNLSPAHESQRDSVATRDTLSALPVVPATPLAAGSGATEQFWTPAQRFPQQFQPFEHANTSILSISSPKQSHIPTLPNVPGLVAGAVEHVEAEYEGDQLIHSSVKGEAVARINGSIESEAVVLGILLADPQAKLSPSSLLHQTSSLSFDVPTSVYSTQQELVEYTSESAVGRVPIKLTPMWRFESSTVRLVLSLQLSDLFVGGSVAELHDLVIAVSIAGTARASSAQSKPVATFSREKQRVTWRFTQPQVLQRGAIPIKLLCQFVTDGAPALPGKIELRARLSSVENSVMQLRSLSSQGEWEAVPMNVSGEIVTRIKEQQH